MSRAGDRPHWFRKCAYGLNAPALHNDLTRRLLRDATGRRRPWLINIAGTVGSGESTLIQRLKAIIKEDYSLIQLDAIMEAYDQDQADRAGDGAEEAFARWERLSGFAPFRRNRHCNRPSAGATCSERNTRQR